MLRNILFMCVCCCFATLVQAGAVTQSKILISTYVVNTSNECDHSIRYPIRHTHHHVHKRPVCKRFVRGKCVI